MTSLPFNFHLMNLAMMCVHTLRSSVRGGMTDLGLSIMRQKITTCQPVLLCMPWLMAL
jgi:hypothetical protein